jgi:2-methylcitrate dehydratase PrpD
MPKVLPPQSTHALATWISGLSLDDIPISVVDHAKNCLLDTLGCGLIGAQQPSGQIVAEMVVDAGSLGPAALWGRPVRTGPADAALVNGTAVHSFEFDDVHDATGLHPGAVVIPAVIAIGEQRGSSGADVLAAIIAGYEAGIRVAYATGTGVKPKGFHMTGVAGSVAAAGAVANLLKLSPHQAVHALSIGATQAGGLYSARRNAMTKRLHAGKAAQNGVLAGLLAEKGFKGSLEAIEAPYGGFLSCFGEDVDPSRLSSALGENWLASETGFKIYPSGASTHTGIDCIDDLMKAGLTTENLDKLTVYMTRHSQLGADWLLGEEHNIEAAQMNGYFVFALKLLTGEVSTRTLFESAGSSKELMKLSKRIGILHDPSFDDLPSELRQKVRVTAHLKSGEVMHSNRDYRVGSSKLRLSDEDIAGKLSELLASVSPGVDPEELIGTVRSLEACKNLGAVLARYVGRK